MDNRGKAIKGMECCLQTDSTVDCEIKECPYHEWKEACTEMMLKNALSLLKAQEPRVLTLDEALEADVCWLEISGSDRVSPCRIGGVNDFFSIRRIDQTPEVCAKKNYGWLLRCWSARPTEEQRKAVKWNG